MASAGTVCRFSWPVEISTGTRALRVTCNGVAATVNLAVATKWWLGDNSANDLCNALDAALQSHPQTPVISVALLSTGEMRITSNLTLTIHWADALTTADETTFGCAAADLVAVGAPGAYIATSPYQVGHLWNPERIYFDDSGSYPKHTLSRSLDLSGKPTTYRWGTRTCRDIKIDLLPPEKILTADSPTNESFELFQTYLAIGGTFVWTPNVSVPATYSTWYIEEVGFLEAWPVSPIAELSRYYQLAIPMLSTTWGA